MTFEPTPEVFDRVELGRIRRKKKHADSRFDCKLGQFLFTMERGIVQDNNGLIRQIWQQATLEPKLKEPTVHHTFVLKRGDNGFSHQSRDDADPFEFASAYTPDQWFASLRPAVCPMQITVDTGFIHISNLFRRYLRNLLQIRVYLLSSLFPVAFRLFLRVNPRRRSAFSTAVSEQPNASPISFK